MTTTRLISRRQPNSSHWFLFLLLPFFAGMKALQNFRAPWAKNILWAFVVFYGFTFTIGKETSSTSSDSGGDINRYVEEFQSLYGKPLTLSESIDFFKESGEADILRTIIAIILSRVTDSQRVLTAVYGFIFGFFFTRNLWYLLSRVKGRLRFYSVILFTSFFLLDSFWEINGFRFNTATHIFVYGLLPYLFEGKKKYIWFSVSSILVHFTFLLPISILFLYMMLGNRSLFYFIFFVISIFMRQIDITAFNEFVDKYVPDVMVERSSVYRDEDKISQYRKEQPSSAEVVIVKNWYAAWYATLFYNAITIILVLLYIMSIKRIRGIPGLYNTFCFTLLFFAISNFMASLPSGIRFLAISSMMAVAVIMFYYQNFSKEQYLHKLFIILTPVFLLYIIVSIRIGFYSIGIQTVVGNPIISFITDYNLSLNDIIK